eukprot:2123288-Rhodomonas_salina.2
MSSPMQNFPTFTLRPGSHTLQLVPSPDGGTSPYLPGSMVLRSAMLRCSADHPQLEHAVRASVRDDEQAAAPRTEPPLLLQRLGQFPPLDGTDGDDDDDGGGGGGGGGNVNDDDDDDDDVNGEEEEEEEEEEEDEDDDDDDDDAVRLW